MRLILAPAALGVPPTPSGPRPVGEDGGVTNHLTDVEVALAAAEAGARIVRAAYGTGLTGHAKSGLDFATNADLDAERAILEFIRVARPGDACVGEESGTGGGPGSRRWLVDPLCGTLNFAAQTPLVAVNVALVEGPDVLVGVSADPISGETFWTDGHGAFVRLDGADVGVSPSARSLLVDVNCDGPAGRPFLGPQLLADPAFRTMFGPRVLSTTLAVAWVAAGRRAAYVTDGSLVDNVHFAAGIGLSRAAGCVVSDPAGEELNAGSGLVVAADRGVHDRLIEIIRPHLMAVRD
ncbi:inositol monophosphatase family protein [Nocardioides sp. B-3]|uniref:inositol monophosphatase family protein n=1 Tax=Nocardioides sp. B-3 TaxID=2895565 RepID=UPI0021531BA5|nr:inositol monophosphatase family protein [Nocardioides sp. B-3]UUZ61753.1 phosphatase [Nocardioides sp. B-3]